MQWKPAVSRACYSSATEYIPRLLKEQNIKYSSHANWVKMPHSAHIYSNSVTKGSGQTLALVAKEINTLALWSVAWQLWLHREVSRKRLLNYNSKNEGKYNSS